MTQAAFDPLPVAGRLVDTRPGGTTVDGRLAGTGRLDSGGVLVVPVAGRAGLSVDVSTVALTVTVVQPVDSGYVAAYACEADPPGTSNQNYRVGTTRAILTVSAVSADGTVCITTLRSTHLVVDAAGSFGDGLTPLPSPVRLYDTRPGFPTIDGQGSGDGPISADADVRFQIAGRGGIPSEAEVAFVGVTAVDSVAPGWALARGCGGARGSSTLNYDGPGDRVANLAVIRLGADGALCLTSQRRMHVVVDVFAWATAAEVAPLPTPARILDTRPGFWTADGEFAGTGTRPARSSMAIPVAGRVGVPDDAGAVILNVTTVRPRQPTYLAVHPGGTERPNTSNVNADSGLVTANAAITPVGADGEICLYNHSTTDVVVDVVGWLPAVQPSTDTGCDAGTLFPDRRIVALYGNDVDARLGVLGEQPPDAAAERLADIAAPFAAGDRPVLGAFELIATIATSFPGSSGLYRSPSSAAHVQRYLDAANANGVHLILDIQPGRGDFLTELQRYEPFLRQPNVHAALDPEWNVGPGQVPGEVVGQVSAGEVNQVADYLSRLVVEEGLPEKMLVVHQFQARMLTDRDALREPAGVAVTIHMDGFGTQSQKLATYDVVEAAPPLNNGFKLFFDEDIDMFTPSEVLSLDPAPDLITYQ